MNTKITSYLNWEINRPQLRKNIKKSLRFFSLWFLLTGALWNLTGYPASHAQQLKVTSLDSEYIYASLFLIEALAKLSHTHSIPISPPSQTNKITPVSDSLSEENILYQGQEISLNGQKFPVAWIQWQKGTSTRIGISDIGSMQTLGMELLNTNNPSLQPIQWFSSTSVKPISLNAYLLSPYRYLDITEFAQIVGWQVEISENILNINSSTATIENIQQENQLARKQILLELDRPTFWQISQTKKESVITIEGIPTSNLLARFQPSSSILKAQEQKDREEEGEQDNTPLLPISDRLGELLTVENSGKTTKLHVKHPPGNSVRIFSLTNPNRLKIDIGSNNWQEKDILWAPGVNWHQSLIAPKATSNDQKPLFPSKFPVVWLELDLSVANVYLKPITSNLNTLVGTSPLLSTARSQQALAAINGGFFNRNNQLPLGAIRQYGRWLSGPILNRAAIAWNEQGQVKIGHLSLQETLITSTKERLPVLFLNSGYVQRGISRYTEDWGNTYTPILDNETIIVVENNQITQQLPGGVAKTQSFPIPDSGYLLILRGDTASAKILSVGTQVSLESSTIPSQFASYSNIVGAGPLLLQNGEIVLNAEAERFSPAFNQQAAIRSAIATTKEGTLIIAAVHESAQARGATLKELTGIMQQLGAVDVLNLDGGSSTSLYLGGQLINRSPVTAAAVHNAIGIFTKE